MKIPLCVKCLWWLDFIMLRISVGRKFTDRLLKCVVRVQWTKGFRGSGVGCSKEARQICVTRNELGALNSSSGEVRASFVLFRPCSACLSLVCPSQEFVGRPQSEECPRETVRCAGVAERFGGYLFFFRLGHITGTSALIYMATVFRCSLMSVPTCCSEDFNFLELFLPLTGS